MLGLLAFSLVVETGTPLCCGVRAPHGDISCPGARAQGHTDLQFLRRMWDPPVSGTEPMPPALAGGCLSARAARSAEFCPASRPGAWLPEPAPPCWFRFAEWAVCARLPSRLLPSPRGSLRVRNAHVTVSACFPEPSREEVPGHGAVWAGLSRLIPNCVPESVL